MTFFIFCLTLILCYLAYFETDKKLTPIERYATLIFAMFLSLSVDCILGLIYNQYYYFDKGIEWRDFLFIVGIYPAISCMYLNNYPYKKSNLNKFIYLMGWSALAIGYEIFFNHTGIFIYQGYHLWYSFLAYPMLFIGLKVNLVYINWLRRKSVKTGTINEVP